MKVADIMNRRPVTVTPDTPVLDVVRLMLQFHLNDVLVVDDAQKLVGIVTYKDIFRKMLPGYGEAMEDATWWNPESMEDRLVDIAKMPVEDAMSDDVHTASPDTYVIQAGSLMNARQVKQLPVVDERELVGVVSYSDIVWGLVTKYAKQLY
jgi:acetoin utilization protein AcuB